MALQMTPWKDRGSCTGFGRQQIRRTEETVYPARTSQGTKWLWPYQVGREGVEPLGCRRRGKGRGRPRAWLGLEKECELLPVGNCWLPTRELEGHWLCCPNRVFFFHQSSPMYHVSIIRYCILALVHPEEIRNPDQTFPASRISIIHRLRGPDEVREGVGVRGYTDATKNSGEPEKE